MDSYQAGMKALVTVGPAFAGAAILALVVSAGFKWIGRKPYRDTINFGNTLRVSVAFSLYAALLGVFLGITSDKNLGPIIATLTTTASALLVYIYGKDASEQTQKLILPAVIVLFATSPLVFEYMRFSTN